MLAGDTLRYYFSCHENHSARRGAPAVSGRAGSAQTTWNFANGYAPTEFQSEGYEMFAQVAEATDGDLEITVHHGGSLFPNPEILQATRDGLVEMGTQLMTNLGRECIVGPRWPAVLRFWLRRGPGAVERRAGAAQGTAGRIRLRLLFAAPWPTQGFFSKEQIESLSDVQGMKMRAYNPSTTRLVELMGGDPGHGADDRGSAGIRNRADRRAQHVFPPRAWCTRCGGTTPRTT